MFQFIILAYNHQKYIIEHLESIKFQIESFGMKNSILTVCDDCSTDLTVSLIEKWLKKNENLFISIEIIVNKSNKGVVANYVSAVEKIETNRYKILAGDDLYYCNSINDVVDTFDFVVTPVIVFTDKMKFTLNMGYLENLNSAKKVKNSLRKGNPFFAPGIFMKKRIVMNRSLLEFLKAFKWIEDYPTWQFLFNLNKSELTYKTIQCPYIMYRKNVGISGNSDNASRSLFLLEEIEMYNFFGVKYGIKEKIIKYLSPKNSILKLKESFEINSNIEKIYLNKANEYYIKLREKADEFLKEINKEL